MKYINSLSRYSVIFSKSVTNSGRCPTIALGISSYSHYLMWWTNRYTVIDLPSTIFKTRIKMHLKNTELQVLGPNINKQWNKYRYVCDEVKFIVSYTTVNKYYTSETSRNFLIEILQMHKNSFTTEIHQNDLHVCGIVTLCFYMNCTWFNFFPQCNSTLELTSRLSDQSQQHILALRVT